MCEGAAHKAVHKENLNPTGGKGKAPAQVSTHIFGC